MKIMGIDIGGSGIKGAPVEIETGLLAGERYRLATPEPASPDAVGDVVAHLVKHFKWKGPVGCTIPAVVRDGVAYTAANIDEAWIGTNGRKLLQRKTRCPVFLLNDADAAGMAEVEFGAGRGHRGVILVLTFGTGIGSAIFVNGQLMPNTELGHIELRGKDAESRVSDRARRDKCLSWKKWARRVNEYLGRIESLFSPDLIIVGGGVSKKHEKFLPLLNTRAQVVPAQLLNDVSLPHSLTAEASTSYRLP
jgi:polyphosphate glucokinase